MTHDENEGGFISHLAELRKRLIHSFIFLIIFFIGCYFFAEHIYGFLVEPFAEAVKDDGSNRRLIFTALQETFLTYLKVSFFTAFFVTCPYILMQVWKFIAPAALFYFRWAAALTVVSGFILAGLNGYLHDAMTFSIGSGVPKHTAIGIGMWLGLIMAFNVWFVIWPNQKRALGIVDCDPDLKAKSARTAMLFSRTNTLLSLPMLLTMVAAQNLY